MNLYAIVIIIAIIITGVVVFIWGPELLEKLAPPPTRDRFSSHEEPESTQKVVIVERPKSFLAGCTSVMVFLIVLYIFVRIFITG